VWTTLDCSHRKTGFKRAFRDSLPIRPRFRIGGGWPATQALRTRIYRNANFPTSYKRGIPTVRSKMGHLPEFLILRDFALKPEFASINAPLIVTSEWGRDECHGLLSSPCFASVSAGLLFVACRARGKRSEDPGLLFAKLFARTEPGVFLKLLES
jgi:hypothetical protein